MKENDHQLPQLPPSMIVSSYITQQEEKAIGITAEHTWGYRDELGIPGSDDRVVMEEDLKRERSHSMAEGPSGIRKRVK